MHSRGETLIWRSTSHSLGAILSKQRAPSSSCLTLNKLSLNFSHMYCLNMFCGPVKVTSNAENTELEFKNNTQTYKR